jgi:hypothetical protein
MEFDPVANEVVYEANNKGRELIMFKVDFEKTYDEGESFVCSEV